MGLKLIHVSKNGPWKFSVSFCWFWDCPSTVEATLLDMGEINLYVTTFCDLDLGF